MSAFTDQLNADISNVFLNTSEFGVAGTYTPSGGSAVVISLILDQPYAAVDPLTGLQVESHDFEATCKASVVTAAGPGATVVIEGATYYVVSEPQNSLDGLHSILKLSKEAIHG